MISAYYIIGKLLFPSHGCACNEEYFFSSAGIPLGFWLTFSWDMGLHGIWIGLSVAIAYLAVTGTYLSLKTDWACEVKKVVERMKEEERLKRRRDEEGGLLTQ